MNRVSLRLAFIAALPPAVAAPAAALPQSETSRPQAIIGATLWDGSGAGPLADAVVVVAGGRISCAGTRRRCPVPRDAVRVDGSGRFLIPGLIDTHVHLLFRRNGVTDPSLGADLRDLLSRGVTTVRDMGNNPARLLEAAAETSPAPRVFAMQLVAGVQFFRSEIERLPDGTSRMHAPAAMGMRQLGWYPLMFRLREDPLAIVRSAREGGAVGLKLYQDLDPAQVAQLVRAAHEAGLTVWGHGWVQPASVLEQSQAGQDGVVHAAGLAGELLNRAARDTLRGSSALLQVTADSGTVLSARHPRVQAALDTLAARGTFLEPTLHASLLSAERANRRNRPIPTLPERYARAASEFGFEVTRLAHRRGVRLVAGTDHTAYGPMAERAQLMEELRLLVDSVGMLPATALLAATRDAALALGNPGRDLGTITAGKRADMLLLTADPLLNVRNLGQIEWVMLEGRVLRPGEW